MRTVTIVGKGKSAEHAGDFIEGDVCSINDALRILPGGRAKWVFLTDVSTWAKLHRFHRTVDHFVCPQYSMTNTDLWKRPGWLNPNKVTVYHDRACEGDHHSLLARIANGRICHHSTTTGAMHWLVKEAKYERVKLIGIDADGGYAAGTEPVSSEVFDGIVSQHGEAFFAEWRLIAQRLAGLLTSVYGAHFEWWHEATEQL